MKFFIPLALLFAPLYAWRFSIFGFPINFLILWVFFVWVIFFSYLIYTNQMLSFFARAKKLNIKILLLLSFFFLSGTISLFVGGVDIKKFGQFLVLFIQPMSIFFIAGFLFNQNPKIKNYLLLATYYLLAVMGIYAIVQYFTLWGLPTQYWGNSIEPKRAVSFFSHPNFYALFSAPLLALLIPDIFISLKTKVYTLKTFSWVLGVVGLLLSMSRAGWLGLVIALFIYLIFAADKKTRKILCGVAIIFIMIIIFTPTLRYRVLLPFYGEKSTNSRIELWASGWRAIKTSPILGLGLNGYADNYQKFQASKFLDTHNFPHNIFLSLWVETGLLGLISLTGLIGLLIYRGLKSRESAHLPIALFLIALLIQGFVDNPYFKNDLAIVFWIILSLII